MSCDPSGRKGYRRIAPSSVRVRLHIRHHKPIGIRSTASVLGHDARGYPMRDERFEVHRQLRREARLIASAPELRSLMRIIMIIIPLE
jgi:hypothetical protein